MRTQAHVDRPSSYGGTLRSGAVLRPTDNGRRRGAELLRMGYPIRLAREDRAGGGDVSEARGRGLRPYRAQHRRTAVPRGVKSRIPRSTRQSLVRTGTGWIPPRAPAALARLPRGSLEAQIICFGSPAEG